MISLFKLNHMEKIHIFYKSIPTSLIILKNSKSNIIMNNLIFDNEIRKNVIKV